MLFENLDPHNSVFWGVSSSGTSLMFLFLFSLHITCRWRNRVSGNTVNAMSLDTLQSLASSQVLMDGFDPRACWRISSDGCPKYFFLSNDTSPIVNFLNQGSKIWWPNKIFSNNVIKLLGFHKTLSCCFYNQKFWTKAFIEPVCCW